VSSGYADIGTARNGHEWSRRKRDLERLYPLAGVLALAPEQRIAGLHRPLRRAQAHLKREPLRHASEAARLTGEIDQFLAETPMLTGP
jgi:hypothetical protein